MRSHRRKLTELTYSMNFAIHHVSHPVTLYFLHRDRVQNHSWEAKLTITWRAGACTAVIFGAASLRVLWGTKTTGNPTSPEPWAMGQS
jgi:hypothetical protein